MIGTSLVHHRIVDETGTGGIGGVRGAGDVNPSGGAAVKATPDAFLDAAERMAGLLPEVWAPASLDRTSLGLFGRGVGDMLRSEPLPADSRVSARSPPARRFPKGPGPGLPDVADGRFEAEQGKPGAAGEVVPAVSRAKIWCASAPLPGIAPAKTSGSESFCLSPRALETGVRE